MTSPVKDHRLTRSQHTWLPESPVHEGNIWKRGDEKVFWMEPFRGLITMLIAPLGMRPLRYHRIDQQPSPTGEIYHEERLQPRAPPPWPLCLVYSLRK
ncbi:hypothetical protein J6590_018924 [Homalodisca vitripennis]|nr:hypothetical protein J6590_018924 [Homalodisca vitripennis]